MLIKRSLLFAWLFVLAIPALLFAQQRQITGQVLADNGQPVAAATIMRIIPQTTPGGKAVPTRHGYPVEEQFNNTENYQEAVQRQFVGTDDLYGKVWWDK